MIQNRHSDEGSAASNGNPPLRSFMRGSVCVIKVNWASVLFFSFFLAYGYYGAITPDLGQFRGNIASSVALLGLLTAILVFFGVLAWKAPIEYQDSIRIRGTDLLVFLLLFAVLYPASYSQLQFSLFSDEISYSATSHGHSIRLSMVLAQRLNAFEDVPFQYVVQAISLILLVSLVGLYFVAKRFSWRNRVIIFAVLFILGRLAFSFMGGNGSPHPPLQLFPPFIFGSLFGITDLSFKFSYFFAYLVFILVLYRMIRRVLSPIPSYLLALSIGTIPLLLHLGSVVEHSLWASMCFTLVAAEIATSDKLHYVRLASVISIMVLMRQPSFLAFLPILMLFFINEVKSGDRKTLPSRLMLIFSPVVLFIPFLGKSILYGTPSTEALDRSTSFLRAIDAINSDVVLASITNSVPYWWVVFIPLAFIPLSKRTADRNIIFALFFAAAVYVYYSIHPSLWGQAKYQAEYAIPFAISGLLLLTSRFSNFPFAGKVIAALSLLVISLNLLNFNFSLDKEGTGANLPDGRRPIISELYRSGRNFLVAYPYSYRAAYDAIKNENLTENSYSIGPTYGIFPEIMNGFSVRSIRAAHEIFTQQEQNKEKMPLADAYVDSVNGDPRIRVVLIGAVNGKQLLIDQFRERGWSVVGDFRNAQYGTSVVALKRGAQRLSERRAPHSRLLVLAGQPLLLAA